MSKVLFREVGFGYYLSGLQVLLRKRLLVVLEVVPEIRDSDRRGLSWSTQDASAFLVETHSFFLDAHLGDFPCSRM